MEPFFIEISLKFANKIFGFGFYIYFSRTHPLTIKLFYFLFSLRSFRKSLFSVALAFDQEYLIIQSYIRRNDNSFFLLLFGKLQKDGTTPYLNIYVL